VSDLCVYWILFTLSIIIEDRILIYHKLTQRLPRQVLVALHLRFTIFGIFDLQDVLLWVGTLPTSTFWRRKSAFIANWFTLGFSLLVVLWVDKHLHELFLNGCRRKSQCVSDDSSAAAVSSTCPLQSLLFLISLPYALVMTVDFIFLLTHLKVFNLNF